MKTVTVDASRQYHIHIGKGLRSVLPERISRLANVEKICIVSDSNVFPLWGNAISGPLLNAGYSLSSFVFPAGEESKTGCTYLSLLEHLADHQLTRTDMILALGGGVVGDLAGFAAATYLRGIRLIQIPTTLLAAVDSSVGGKTAIDLPSGKNLAGAFYQPEEVLCDTELLNTLPESVLRDGCAEVIKYAVLYDPQLFEHLEEKGLRMDREEVIARCVGWKRDAVVADEFDWGLRKKLNLGHTFGHAIEKCSSYSISHGAAVSVGMAIISRAATRTGSLSEWDCRRILTLLDKFGLPTTTSYCAEQLREAALSDKKRSGGSIDLIVPQAVGKCEIRTIPVDELKPVIQAGL